jgi:transglutaminase-like putative cysteine protease
VFIELSFIFGLPSTNLIIKDSNASYKPSINQLDYETGYYKLQVIEQSATKIYEATEYVIHVYDCTEFSRDLVKELRANNISARCVFGAYQEDRYHRYWHTWVEVYDKDFDNKFYVEATGGYIIPEDEFKEHYEISAWGVCA